MGDDTGRDRSGEQQRCLLVVLDESPLGTRAAEVAVALAALMRARALFHVAMPMEVADAESPTQLMRALPEHVEAGRQRARPVFDAAQALASRAGVASDTVLTVDEVPIEAVQRVAAENACSLIVVGSHGRGHLSRMLHGSLVDELVQRSERPVVVCREDTDPAVVATGHSATPAAATDPPT